MHPDSSNWNCPPLSPRWQRHQVCAPWLKKMLRGYSHYCRQTSASSTSAQCCLCRKWSTGCCRGRTWLTPMLWRSDLTICQFQFLISLEKEELSSPFSENNWFTSHTGWWWHTDRRGEFLQRLLQGAESPRPHWPEISSSTLRCLYCHRPGRPHGGHTGPG